MMLCIVPMTETKSPVSGETTKETVKTIAQGVPDPGSTCGDYARVLFKFAREAVGASFVPGIPCALCFLRDVFP